MSRTHGRTARASARGRAMSRTHRWTAGPHAEGCSYGPSSTVPAHQDREELACHVALEATDDLLLALAVLGPPGHVGPRRSVGREAGQDDPIEGAVRLPITATVEPMAGGQTGRGRHRAG